MGPVIRSRSPENLIQIAQQLLAMSSFYLISFNLTDD